MDTTKPVAYLHNVAFGDEEPDQALSFKAESFPLEGVAGYRKVSCEPLILQSAHDKALSESSEQAIYWRGRHGDLLRLTEKLEAALTAANARADAAGPIGRDWQELPYRLAMLNAFMEQVESYKLTGLELPLFTSEIRSILGGFLPPPPAAKGETP